MTIPESSEASTQDQFNDLAAQIQKLESVIPQLMALATERGLPDAQVLPKLLETARQTLNDAQTQVNHLGTRREQLQELVHTSALLTSSLELDPVLEEVMDTVIRLIGAERVYLMLRDPNRAAEIDSEGDDLKVRAARSWEHENIQPAEVSFSRGVAMSAVKQQAPIVTTNAHMGDYTGLVNTIGLTMRSVVCIPLRLRDTTIGVLYADKKMKSGMFSQDAIPMLSAFANQAAIAIENARLFEQVRDELIETQQQARRIIIEIDEKKTSRHLDDIINSEFFKQLRDSTGGDRDKD
jgi:GAF domain-containing protein